jgi:hypothetical protein
MWNGVRGGVGRTMDVAPACKEKMGGAMVPKSVGAVGAAGGDAGGEAGSAVCSANCSVVEAMAGRVAFVGAGAAGDAGGEVGSAVSNAICRVVDVTAEELGSLDVVDGNAARRPFNDGFTGCAGCCSISNA